MTAGIYATPGPGGGPRRRALPSEARGAAIEVAATRHTLGWTQRQLALELGVSATTVSRWENGATEPHPAILTLLRIYVQRILPSA